MEELTENVIQLDGSIGVKEASDTVKPIANKEVKNLLYHHILVTEGIWKYLNDNDIVNCEPVNLRSCAKFLSEFEYTDIQLPNLSICVRAVYDEEILFVPKSHFEHNITPDVYLFVKVDDELKTGNVLGFVRPNLINKKNDNGKYYFVNRTFLKPFSELISLIKNSNLKEQYVISDKTEVTIEKLIVGYFDNDIDKNKKEKLFNYLINSSIAREKFVEFENFERLSYLSLAEFKDLDVENNDFSKYIKTLFPQDEFSDFETVNDLTAENDIKTTGGLYIDDDLVQSDDKINSVDNIIADEFEIFENQEDELPSILQNEEFNEEISADLPAEYTVTDEQLKETEVFNENEFTNAAIADIPIDTDEDIVVPEDLELNVLDDINQQSKGLDADTVIGLTEDVLYEGEEQHPMETELSQELTVEKELNEPDFITTDEIDKVIEEVTAQEAVQTPELNELTDITGETEFSNAMEEISETDTTDNDTVKIFDDADIDISLIDEDTPYQSELKSTDDGSIFLQDEDDDVGMIKSSSVDSEIVNDENIDLNEIYNENELESDIVNPTEIANENITNDEYKGTDFAFASDNRNGFTLQKKVIVAISAGVIILCLAGIGAWHLLFQSKSTDNNIAITDNTGNTEMADFNFDKIDMTGNSQTDIIDDNPVKSNDDNISANVKLPAQLPAMKENEEQSEQLTIQKIKKDFSKPNTYISVSKIVWDVPEYMTYNDDFNVYLQTVGSSLKVNLSSDLLLITESPILNSVKLKISIKNNGKNYSADIIQGCGTQSIDNLVLQSVKKTMDILKPPVNNLDTADEDIYLTICL